MDEFLWFPMGLSSFLASEKKKRRVYDFFPIRGYNMASTNSLSNKKRLDEQVLTGYPDKLYSKNNIFNPNTIIDMNFSPGSHQCHPEIFANKFIIGPTIYLLHYKFIGGIDRLKKRQLEYGIRLSKMNKNNCQGLHYLKKPFEIEKEYNIAINKSTKII
jgi:hypothetical protein